MIYKEVKGFDIPISVIGYGGWGAGIKGWGNVNEWHVRDSIQEALRQGISLYDTSPIYGNGKSESILGEELKSFRKYVLISTKFGLVDSGRGNIVHDLSRDSMLRELDQSLNRLQTDYIDIYTVHFPFESTNLENVCLELEELKRQGIIKNAAFSNMNYEQVKLGYSHGINCIQNKFNYFSQSDLSDIIPFCNMNEIAYIAYSPLEQGIFSRSIDNNYSMSKKDIRRFNPMFADKEKFEKAIDFVKNIENDPVAFALSYVFKSGVTSAIITMTKKEHVESNSLLCDIILQNS